MDLEKKTVIVTGAGQGLGKAICRLLAQSGAIIIATDINGQTLEELCSEITGNKGQCISYIMDVSNVDQVLSTVAGVTATFGKIDIVINNAGIDFTLPLEELAYEQFRKVIEVNLVGAFNLSRAVYPQMKHQQSGHIVNVSSTASKRAWPNASAYHASKWGLLGFSHALHSEARKNGIKVTAVVAGGMKTPFILDRFPEAASFLQDPVNVAETIRYILCQPKETVIPEVFVLPMNETSWP